MAANPTGSLPAQMQTWRETKALSRLLDEPEVTFAALIQPHLHQPREPAKASPVVLLVRDTTDIDLSHRHTISGVGQSGNERGRGFFVQTVLAVRPEPSEVLGCMAQEPFVRMPAPSGEQRYGRRKRDERETHVWMRQVHAIGSPEPGSMWVHVGDRGADMFPFFHACQATQTHLLVRAGKSRRVQQDEDKITYSLSSARSWPSQANRPFEVPARHGRQARSTQLQLAFGQMTLLPPRARATGGEGLHDGVGHSRLGRAGSQRRRAAGMDRGDLDAHHDAGTSLGARRVVSTQVAGGGLSSMPQKWLSH
jgi:hypothetical protein